MSASYILAAAAAIPPSDEKLWSPNDLREFLAKLAQDLEPGETIDQQATERAERMPLTGAYLAEALGRQMFRAEAVHTDYERCVLVAQLFGDSANQLDIKQDHARANLLREFAHAVSVAGGGL